MFVKVTGSHVNVWDREQGDDDRGLVVPSDGTPIEVEATRTIMDALKDKRLVEAAAPATSEAAPEAPADATKAKPDKGDGK